MRFIGVVIGSAVLPRIAACDAQVAATVVNNMKIRTSASDAPMVADGYEAVIAAVETTYACLGITCANANSVRSRNFNRPTLHSHNTSDISTDSNLGVAGLVSIAFVS